MNFLPEFISQGGWIMYILILESILVVTFISQVATALFRNLGQDLNHELQSKLIRKVEWLSHLASLSTLTGLLGTVLGIYTSFKNMQIQGKISLETFSSGISTALITTIYGLSTAIVAIFFYHFLADRIEEKESLSNPRNLEN